MKTHFTLYLTLLMLVSCSSVMEWNPSTKVEDGDLKLKFFKPKGFEIVRLKIGSKRAYDTVEHKYYVVYGIPLDADVKFLQWKEEGRIDREPSHSCFGTNQSVNFISIMPGSVQHLREFLVEQKTNVSFMDTEGVYDGKFRKFSSEEQHLKLKVKREECFREVNGYKEMIVSEIYN